MLWTKRTHRITIFQTFQCSNENSPNSSCHFWNHNVRVYSNFTSLFSVMKDNSSVFYNTPKDTPLITSSNLVYFGKKAPIEKKFSNLWMVECKFTKFLVSYLKPQVRFSLNFASLFRVIRGNSSAFF